MKPDINVCIVIPCYNEEKGFLLEEYSSFIAKHHNVLLCFVNDGSTDNTLKILTRFKKEYSQKVEIVSYEKNKGKAEAVRIGVLYCNDRYKHKYVAFLDADLSTSLQECVSLTKYFDNNIEFSFGSRIAKIGSVIDRKKSRFLIGRIIATFISNMLTLKVYDTQCGCKLFTKNLSKQIFADCFISKWLFDVEIFFRIFELYGKENSLKKMIEIPLTKWTHRGNSKVKVTYFFNLWFDMYNIRRKYKQTLTKNKLHKNERLLRTR